MDVFDLVAIIVTHIKGAVVILVGDFAPVPMAIVMQVLHPLALFYPGQPISIMMMFAVFRDFVSKRRE